MKTAMSELRRTIRGIIRESMSDWGEVAFDPERNAPVMDPPETNTPEEADALTALADYLQSTSHIPDSILRDLRDHLASGRYADILIEPPPSSLLFRGLRVSPEQLSRWLGGAEVRPGVLSQKDGSWVMKPQRGTLMSFTANEDIAEAFSGLDGVTFSEGDDLGGATDAYHFVDSKVAVIMVARAADNRGVFLDIPRLVKMLGVDDRFKSSYMVTEHEALALGPVRVHRLVWKYSVG